MEMKIERKTQRDFLLEITKVLAVTLTYKKLF